MKRKFAVGEISTMNKALHSAVIFCVVCIAVMAANAKPPSVNKSKQITEYELQTLAEGEDRVRIDTTYYTTIENLDDLPVSNLENDFDFINYGGGAVVVNPRTAMVESERVDLLEPPNIWYGPYVTFDPNRISDATEDYDEGSLLDFWGNPYYFFTPLGLVKPRTESISLELYGDYFDRYAIVSLGPDGKKSSDDIIRLFGGAPTELVISSLNPSTVQHGDEVTVRGYNFGEEQGGSQVVLNDFAIPTILSWSDREVRFQVPHDLTSGALKICKGAGESNSLHLEITGTPTGLISDWELYY